MSFAALGASGGLTVGVIVAEAFWPKLSATTYFTGVCTVPEKLGSGSNVTTPVEVFTEYVPSPGTVNESNVQNALLVEAVAQNRTDAAFNVTPVAAASPVKTSIT
jgi:hypothetical protein